MGSLIYDLTFVLEASSTILFQGLIVLDSLVLGSVFNLVLDPGGSQDVRLFFLTVQRAALT